HLCAGIMGGNGGGHSGGARAHDQHVSLEADRFGHSAHLFSPLSDSRIRRRPILLQQVGCPTDSIGQVTNTTLTIGERQKSGLLATGIGSSFWPKGLTLSPSAQLDSMIPSGACALRARIWRCTGLMKDAGSSMVTSVSNVLPPSIR